MENLTSTRDKRLKIDGLLIAGVQMESVDSKQWCLEQMALLHGLCLLRTPHKRGIQPIFEKPEDDPRFIPGHILESIVEDNLDDKRLWRAIKRVKHELSGCCRALVYVTVESGCLTCMCSKCGQKIGEIDSVTYEVRWLTYKERKND